MRLSSGRPEVFEFGRESLASDGTFHSRGVESLRFDRLVDPVQDARDRYDELAQSVIVSASLKPSHAEIVAYRRLDDLEILEKA